MNAPDMFREENHLAGKIAEDLYDDFWAKLSFRYDQHEYELIGSDEGAELLGRGDDDPYLTLLRRKSDGQLFEIEFEVTAWAREPVQPEHQEAPGQEALPLDGAA